MRLRTFTAPDMPAAMKLVREALGDEAIILSTQVHKDTKAVHITAAVEIEDDSDQRPAVSGQKTVSSLAADRRPPPTEPLRFQLQETLRFHNMPEMFIAKLMQRATDKELATIHKPNPQRILEKLLDGFFDFDPLSFEAGSRTMLIGPPGTGKTLTIARMAARLAMNKHSVKVITTDNKRAGGIEQLQSFTDILDIPLYTASSKNELASHLKSLDSRTRVLIDTAGCNPYEPTELKELHAYMLSGIEPVLVLPAGGDSLEAIDMVEAYAEALPLKRLLVTRADTARRFGGILAAAAAHGLTFCNATGSSSITEPLRSLDAALLARLLLQYQQ